MQLQRIRIYPLKSFAGVEVPSAGFTPAGGLRDDRRWCLVRKEAAEINAESVYMTKVDKTSEASAIARTHVHHGSPVGVMTLELDGQRSPEFRLPDAGEAMAAWCSQQYGVALRLQDSSERGFSDAAVYGSAAEFATVSGPTVISTTTLDYLSDHLALTSEQLMLRFRANLLVHDDALEPFGEEELTEIVLGDVRLEVRARVPRCPVPARDTTTGAYDRAFTRNFVEAKSQTRIGGSLDRGELYTASVFTHVATPDATLNVNAD